MSKKNLTALAVVSRACAALSLTAGLAFAQGTGKTVVAEPVAVMSSFGRWVISVAPPVPETPVDLLQVQPVTWAVPAAPAARPASVFQPRPVILGQPDLPLLGDGMPAARTWNSGMNYQGMHVKVVALDARNGARRVRPVSAPPRIGERFKLRVTSTFDGVASIDRTVGAGWAIQRTGQAYPQSGTSVQINAGETVDLPLDANAYFVMTEAGVDGLVVSVRHPKAVRDAASDQPAYREDGARGSSYLQLVPAGKFPAFEQLMTAAR